MYEYILPRLEVKQKGTQIVTQSYWSKDGTNEALKCCVLQETVGGNI